MSQDDTQLKKFDLRTLEFLLNRGEISAKAYEQYLKSLPDDDGNFEEVTLEDEPVELEEDPAY